MILDNFPIATFNQLKKKKRKKKTGPFVNCRLIDFLYIFET